MTKSIKYFLGAIVVIFFIAISLSERIVTLGIVSNLKEVNTVEIVIDGKLHSNLELEQSIIPIKMVQIELSPGFHTIKVKSHNCGLENSFRVFNIIGYNINVEYYETEDKTCGSLIRESIFGLVYM